MVDYKKWAGVVLAALLAWGVAPVPGVLAYGNVWMNEHADIQAKQFKKIVLFPFEPGSGYEFLDDTYNNHLYKEARKRVKKTNFLSFATQIEEKDAILRANTQLDSLNVPFGSEEERCKAVYDRTAADGYLVPRVTRDETEEQHFPAEWVKVKMESYYDIIDGPNGNKYQLDHKEWYVDYLVPAADRTLTLFDMNFTLYDAYTGGKAMTYVDYYRDYGGKSTAVEEITKRFAKDWAVMRKDKRKKPKKGAPTLGFGEISLPDAASDDELAIKSIWYAVKDEAADTMKNVEVEYDPGSADYRLDGAVTSWHIARIYHPAGALVFPQKVKSVAFEWYDDKNKKHTGYRNYYQTFESDIDGYQAHYSYDFVAGLALTLTDTRTGEVIFSWEESNENDSYGDALRAVLHGFYKDADNMVKKINKDKEKAAKAAAKAAKG